MMKIGIAIVGVGYWGPNLVKSFYQSSDAEVLFCVDLDRKKLLGIQRQYPTIKITDSLDTVLKDPAVTAVVIATPSNTHAGIICKALKHDKHVFVEKPFTLSTKEARTVITLNKKTKKIILVGHTYEYHPAILQIKKEIKAGTIGDLFYIYCSRLNLGKVREETNALWNLAPHDISILNFLIGNSPLKVNAFGKAYLQKKNEDVVFVNLLYPNNTVAHIHVSWLDPRKERSMTLVGSKKMIMFDDMDNEASLRIYDKGFIKLVNEKGERIFGEFTLKLRPGDIKLPYIEPKEPLREECLHFIQCIIENKSPRSGAESGLAVVKVLEAAQESLDKQGVWVHLK